MRKTAFLFPISTPALLACEAAKQVAGQAGYWDLFDALQKAFFVDSRNVEEEEVLASCVQQVGIDVAAWVETTVTYLRELIPSMTISTRKVFIKRPSIAYSPVRAPNSGKVAAVIKKSEASNALPISIEVYLDKIIATMSVPPVEAPMLNAMFSFRFLVYYTHNGA